jgi:hypothetical protein
LGCFWLNSWTRSGKSCKQFPNPPTQHDVQSQKDTQMSLDYHVVDPLGDDEKDELQSDSLDGC